MLFSKRKPDAPKPPVPAEPAAPAAQAAGPSAEPVPPALKEPDMARPPSAFTPPASALRIGSAAPASDRRTLIIGPGISVTGTVQNAERLEVQGTVEAAAINGLAELAVAPGGLFKGEVEVEEAEISGTIDGTLTARQTLIVRSTGRVLGTARCRRLQVEDGGQITGRMEMLTDTPAEG